MSWWLLSDAVFVFPDTQPLSLKGVRVGPVGSLSGLMSKHRIDMTELKVNVCISKSSWM